MKEKLGVDELLDVIRNNGSVFLKDYYKHLVRIYFLGHEENGVIFYGEYFEDEFF